MTVDSQVKVDNLNADRLDGLTAFLPATGKATDADRLDGINSSAFIQGAGNTYARATTLPIDTDLVVDPPVAPGLANITFQCSIGGSNFVYARNLTSDPINVFVEGNPGGTSAFTDYLQVAPGSFTSVFNADPTGDVTTFFVQGTPSNRQTVATIRVGSVRRASDCHLQIQALITPQ
jgi:hypothetical protein